MNLNSVRMNSRPPIRSGKIAIIISGIILLTMTGCMHQARLGGELVYGHEVRTVRLCSGEKTYWLYAETDLHRQLLESYQSQAAGPYQSIYLEFSGHRSEAAGEFAKQYDGAFRAEEIHLISKEIPEKCAVSKP